MNKLFVLIALLAGACVEQGDTVHPSYVYDDRTELCFVVNYTHGSHIVFTNVPCNQKVMGIIADAKYKGNK